MLAEESKIGTVLPADRALLSALASEVALTSLLHDDDLEPHRELDDRDAPATARYKANAALEDVLAQRAGRCDGRRACRRARHAVAAARGAACPRPLTKRAARRGGGEALARLLCRGGAALRRLNVAQTTRRRWRRRARRGVRDGGARLKKLVLARNALGDQAAYALGAALASNKTLGALSLWGNERISAAASAQLRAAWQRNGLLSLDDD